MQGDHKTDYKAGSLNLLGAVSMGTGVMIGAGIFALTGQVAELAGGYFPLAFLGAAIVTAFSAYSYVKMSNAFPSAGGIGMYLQKAYGKGLVTAVCALLMALSMVINESLVARTFGSYTLRLFDLERDPVLVPALGVGLLIFAFIVNLASNRIMGTFAFVMAAAKILGIVIFAGAGLWVADRFPLPQSPGAEGFPVLGFLAAMGLGILAYKGFTTITNSGGELKDPHRNVGRAIIISILICVVIYMLVAGAVSANLSIDRIISARDTSLAEAARPALGQAGLWFTIAIAIIATVSGVIASIFAVSRMLTMLTEMELIPHRHFGMPGPLQKHLVVYTVVIAIFLTVFFDLGRIAALGAIYYLIMDIAIHWGILRHLRGEVDANRYVVATAIFLDVVVLGAFIAMKAASDPLIVVVAVVSIAALVLGEWFFLRRRQAASGSGNAA